MNSNNNNRIENHRRQSVPRILSTMGCSWNTIEPNRCDENSIISTLKIPSRIISYPSFSLTDNEEQNEVDQKDYDSDASSCHKRETVQSKASKLMSRKRVFRPLNLKETFKQGQAPQRIMLENILDSFDRLVDARIRAYARILSNHVRVLSESNNTKGAQIAEYKLQTLLEVAANHLLFDSISTKFDVSSDGDTTVSTNSTTVTTTSTEKEGALSTPVELTVEIRSPRFFFEGLKTMNCGDAASSPPQQGLDGKLIFRAKGKLRGKIT